MSDKDILSKEERKELCTENQCKEHSNGNKLCPVPLYTKDLQQIIEENSADSSNGTASPRTASAKVVRSDK
jgi:hypothetical protein